MAESPDASEGKTQAPKSETVELGIMESYGSFPVWLLKIILWITPSFLISKTPPKKKKLRI